MSGTVDNDISDSEGVGYVASSQASLSSIEEDVHSDLSDNEGDNPTEQKTNSNNNNNGLKKKSHQKSKKLNGFDDLDNNASGFVYSVEVAMLEIYNETVSSDMTCCSSLTLSLSL
jgi:hypothetical protein